MEQRDITQEKQIIQKQDDAKFVELLIHKNSDINAGSPYMFEYIINLNHIKQTSDWDSVLQQLEQSTDKTIITDLITTNTYDDSIKIKATITLGHADYINVIEIIKTITPLYDEHNYAPVFAIQIVDYQNLNNKHVAQFLKHWFKDSDSSTLKHLSTDNYIDRYINHHTLYNLHNEANIKKEKAYELIMNTIGKTITYNINFHGHVSFFQNHIYGYNFGTYYGCYTYRELSLSVRIGINDNGIDYMYKLVRMVHRQYASVLSGVSGMIFNDIEQGKYYLEVIQDQIPRLMELPYSVKKVIFGTKYFLPSTINIMVFQSSVAFKKLQENKEYQYIMKYYKAFTYKQIYNHKLHEDDISAEDRNTIKAIKLSIGINEEEKNDIPTADQLPVYIQKIIAKYSTYIGEIEGIDFNHNEKYFELVNTCENNLNRYFMQNHLHKNLESLQHQNGINFVQEVSAFQVIMQYADLENIHYDSNYKLQYEQFIIDQEQEKLSKLNFELSKLNFDSNVIEISKTALCYAANYRDIGKFVNNIYNKITNTDQGIIGYDKLATPALGVYVLAYITHWASVNNHIQQEENKVTYLIVTLSLLMISIANFRPYQTHSPYTPYNPDIWKQNYGAFVEPSDNYFKGITVCATILASSTVISLNPITITLNPVMIIVAGSATVAKYIAIYNGYTEIIPITNTIEDISGIANASNIGLKVLYLIKLANIVFEYAAYLTPCIIDIDARDILIGGYHAEYEVYTSPSERAENDILAKKKNNIVNDKYDTYYDNDNIDLIY